MMLMVRVARINQEIYFFSFDSVVLSVNWNVYIGLWLFEYTIA